MQKWEYTMKWTNIASVEGSLLNRRFEVDPSLIWTQKSGKDNTTAFEDLKKLGKDGWEIIAVTPICDYVGDASGATSRVLFTLKRPLAE